MYPDGVLHQLSSEIQQTGSTYNIKSHEVRKRRLGELDYHNSPNINSINFQMRLNSKYSAPNPLNYKCELNGGELNCTVNDKAVGVQRALYQS